MYDYGYDGMHQGSSVWAEARHMIKAGLLNHKINDGTGMYYGDWRNRAVRLKSDAPSILFGGSGAGKFARLLGVQAITALGRTVWVDPKGEICAVALDGLAHRGKGGWVINPLRLHGLPHHTIDPASFIKAGMLSTTADIQMLCADLIPLSSKTDPFFEKRERAWAEAFFKFDCLKHGQVSLLRVADSISLMQRDGSEAWKKRAKEMIRAAPEIAAVVSEIVSMQVNGSRAYGIICAGLNSAFGFLSDPALRQTVSEKPDLDLEAYVTQGRDDDIFFCIPAEVMEVWSGFIRLFMSALAVIKARNPRSKTIDYVIDEAGQLGNAEFIKRGYTLLRGAGIRTHAVYQDIDQVEKSFGSNSLTTLVGSAQCRQFIGVRDRATSRMVADMLGSTTLRYQNPVRVHDARHTARKSIFNALRRGEDIMSATIEAKGALDRAQVPDTMPRPLANPAEVMRHTEDHYILFVSGKNCPPILGDLRNYFERPELRGAFFPHPTFDDACSVKIPTWFGVRRRAVIDEDVPACLTHLPQFKNRPLRFVEGFRPRFKR